MATAQYNEVTHTNVPVDCLDPMFHYDTHYPEPLSKLNINDHPSAVVARRNRRGRSRAAGRYKTQPITFDEIKEVDEEGAEDNKASLRTQFAAFSRSMDGLVPRIPGSGKQEKADAPAGQEAGQELRVSSQDAPSRTGEEIPTPDAEAASTCSEDTPAPVPACPVPDLGLPKHLQHERRRRRTKRNRDKSIEEVPESEKLVDGQGTSG